VPWDLPSIRASGTGRAAWAAVARATDQEQVEDGQSAGCLGLRMSSGVFGRGRGHALKLGGTVLLGLVLSSCARGVGHEPHQNARALQSAEARRCPSGELCWDFEEGRIPDGWTPYRDELSGTLQVDQTRPHGGRFALHAMSLAGGVEGTAGGPKKTLKFTLPEGFGGNLWGRIYVYTSPARPKSHAGLFNARYARPASTSTSADIRTLDWYEVATYQQTYMAIWHPPEPPGYPEWVLHSDEPLKLDAWACLEWQFDGDNGDERDAADPRVWLDGTEIAWARKFVFSDPAGAPRPVQEKAGNFRYLELGVFLYQGLSVPTDWWLDDLAIGAGRIGCAIDQ